MLSYIYKEGLGVEKDIFKSFTCLVEAYKYKDNCFYNYCGLFKNIDEAMNKEFKTFIDVDVDVDEVEVENLFENEDEDDFDDHED